MRLPVRWNKIRRFLWPLALFYRALVWWRNLFYQVGFFVSKQVSLPVISVGNLTVGGTGKTPAVIYLAQLLTNLGYRPGIVSRGYGRITSGTVWVSNGREIFADSSSGGDEPLLMAKRLTNIPVIVDENRHRGAQALEEKASVDVILLDDGFQHRGLARAIDIVLLNATETAGDYRMFPQGSLREPLNALKRSAVVIWTRTEKSAIDEPIASRVQTIQPHQLRSQMSISDELIDLQSGRGVAISQISTENIVAFCGIAKPRSFYHTLFSVGLEPQHVRYFDDHHRYTEADLRELATLADIPESVIITTEKDGVKLDEAFLASHPVYAVRLDFQLSADDEKQLTEILIERLPLPVSTVSDGEA